jgi:hypothetical protein
MTVTWLVPIAAAIPAELRARPQWVIWRAEGDAPGKKPAKVPYCAAQPTGKAKCTDPTTWATFDRALAAYHARAPHRWPIAGIAFALTAETGITVLDLDRVRGEAGGAIDPAAHRILARAYSWTEWSPSNTGWHVFVRGVLPRSVVGDGIEIYTDRRFMAMTGHRVAGTPETIQPQQAYLDALAATATAARRQRSIRPPCSYRGASAPPPDDLAGAVLAKLSAWGVATGALTRWSDGYRVAVACPWADTHTSGDPSAVVMIHASGAFAFRCLHAHCADRDWRAYRAAMEIAT